MMPTLVKEQAPVPPPCYQRAQARQSPALHIDALTLVTTLHLLTLCRLAIGLAHRRCPPPLPAGPGGAPRTYSEESLLLIGLLRTLWRLSYHVNSSEKIPKSATQKVSRVGKFTLAFSSASLKIPRTSVL